MKHGYSEYVDENINSRFGEDFWAKVAGSASWAGTFKMRAWPFKSVLTTRQRLRPLRTLLIAENPTGHVLGLDHENAEARNDDVVDLRRSVACGQRNVVDVFVDVGVKEDFLGEGGLEFAREAFEE